jgi:hypothetical protein
VRWKTTSGIFLSGELKLGRNVPRLCACEIYHHVFPVDLIPTGLDFERRRWHEPKRVLLG